MLPQAMCALCSQHLAAMPPPFPCLFLLLFKMMHACMHALCACCFHHYCPVCPCLQCICDTLLGSAPITSDRQPRFGQDPSGGPGDDSSICMWPVGGQLGLTYLCLLLFLLPPVRGEEGHPRIRLHHSRCMGWLRSCFLHVTKL